MPLFARLRTGVKAIAAMMFARYQGWNGSAWLGSTRFDYGREVTPGANAIVMAVVGWLMRTFPEAPPRVLKRVGTELTAMPDHPMVQLLRRPNPFYSGVLLWMATVASFILDGNSYWIKVRSRAGKVVELWWIPPFMVVPCWPDDGSTFIGWYEYRPDGRLQPIRLEIVDVVHFRYGMDPDNPRKGLAPLAALLREIFTDDQGANFTAALLRNLGVPGVVISPDDRDTEIGKPEADQLKSEFSNRFGGDRRGEPLVLSGKTKVTVLSFSPEQMNLKALRRIPEERVTAVIGIPAMVVGLGAGLDRSTFTNYREAREAAYESNVIPTQRLFAEELRVQLLSDFGEIANFEVDFDLANVRVLQDDQDKLFARMRGALLAGGIPLNTYLRKIGEAELPAAQGDVFYVPKNVVPTPADQLTPPPGGVAADLVPAAPPPNGHVLVPAA